MRAGAFGEVGRRRSQSDRMRGLLDARRHHRRGNGGTIVPLGLDRGDLVAGAAFVHVEEGA